MKTTLTILLSVLSIAPAYAQLRSQVPLNTPPPQSIDIFLDGYVAQVEDIVITDSDVRELMLPRMAVLYQRYRGADLESELQKLHDSARDELIERALVQKAFAENGGQIPDQYIEDEIRRVIRERFEGDEPRFEKLLSDQKKTREEYKDVLKKQIVYSVMYGEEVNRRARVTPQQVRDEYERRKESYHIPEQVKYSVILLNKGESEEDQTVKLEEARTIHEQLLGGADFTETAKKVSEGSRASDGGVFQWMKPDDVRPELQETLRALSVGEISSIITTEKELYILKLDGRQAEGYRTFEAVRKDLKAELLAAEKERLKNRWINRLRSKYYVNIYK